MNDKWAMFKNYMHNELGITKEDIRQWIDDSVEKQAKKLVDNEFKRFDVRDVVSKIIGDEQYFGGKTLKREIATELTKQIMGKLRFEQDGKENIVQSVKHAN